MIRMSNSQLGEVVKRQGFTIVELLVVITVIGILSVITVVSYTGITQQANVARMQVELESAYKKLNMFYTENDTYPVDLSAAKDAKLIPTDSKTNEIYVADNSVNPAYYCYSFTTGTETYAIDSSSSVSKGGCLTNLVTNGDFSNGTTGWGADYGTLSASSNELTFTATSDRVTSARILQLIGTIAGHKYYVHGSIMRTNANKFRPMVGADSLTLTAVANTYVTYGVVVTALNTGSHSVYLPDTVAGEVIKFKNLLVIDLTEAFGAGNEPTAEQMDAYLAAYPDSWFDGTKKGSLFW